jgi:hypothetical protein
MRRRLLLGLGAAICAAAIPSIALADLGGRPNPGRGRHVLLISVDGLHQSDVTQWIDAHPNSTFAWLAGRGTSYSETSSTLPSDSFPGTLALTTGGTSKSTGVYYDDSFDRSLYPPSDTTCSGPVGTEVLYAEPADVNPDALNGGVSSHNAASLDPNKLPRAKTPGGCVPFYPNQFLRVNTIFDVIHNAGLRTAWSDKHPAYQLLNGPNNAHAIDDLFTPEINSLVPGDPNGLDWTGKETYVQQYDTPKVQAVLDQIAGKSSFCVDEPAKCTSPGVPAILGMNFQSVSVGQKLPNPGSPLNPNGCGTGKPCPYIGGYAPDGSFNPNMTSAMQFVDSSLGKMVAALQSNGLLDKTEIIVSAKHGQSPIDPASLHRVDPGFLPNLVSTTTGAQFPDTTTGLGQQASVTEDDVGMLWLSKEFQPKTGNLLSALGDPGTRRDGFIDRVISGKRLDKLFGNPATDPRIPDAIVLPNHGGLYSFSKKKVAEHGGGTADDHHVALIVVEPGRGGGGRTVDTWVHTTQVAPTILAFLGLDPNALQAVRKEGTQVLPG